MAPFVIPAKAGILTAQSGFPIELGMTFCSESVFISSLLDGTCHAESQVNYLSEYKG